MPHAKEKALGLLRNMLGDQALFRTGQWEAVNAVVNDRHRLLLAQKTGWGKSVVYFIATRLLRDEGKSGGNNPTNESDPRKVSRSRQKLRSSARCGWTPQVC